MWWPLGPGSQTGCPGGIFLVPLGPLISPEFRNPDFDPPDANFEIQNSDVSMWGPGSLKNPGWNFDIPRPPRP